MLKRKLFLAFGIAALAVAAASCRNETPASREARTNFDAYENAPCPAESKVAIARKLKAKSDEVRIAYYAATGRKDSTAYFAAMSRKGHILVGVFDEAPAVFTKIEYDAQFAADDFVWAVKCLRNDPPFSDRQVHYGRPFPVKITAGPRDVKVEFIDGWIPARQKWSAGYVKVNLAGTALLEEKHALDFAIATPEPE